MESKLGLEGVKGISDKEALLKLEEDGYNELPSAKKKGLVSVSVGIVKEPMFLLLIACGSLYLFLGNLEEALMLLGFVFVVMGITIFQESKTERALDALKELSSPRALVIRNGQKKRISARELVRGDVVILSEGDRIPADAILLECNSLSIDESLLTGESAPVRKCATDNVSEMGPPGGDDLPYIYSGTLAVGGSGVSLVKATGLYTEIGKIGRSLQTLETEKTQLQKETHDIVRNLAIGGAMLCAAVIILYGLTRGDWIGGMLAGLALAMSILPEEFPVILTIFLALGAWRMSKKNVLARRQHAIQALGSATVLCVDKTGTLTENRMSLKTLYANGKEFKIDSNDLPEGFHELVEFGMLSSQKDPFDPMEKALKELSIKSLSGTKHVHHNWVLMHEYPLSKYLLSVSHVWKAPEEEDYIIAAKGAPEAIWELCHLKDDQIQQLSERVGEMADSGLRVIGVAKSSSKVRPLPSEQHDFDFEFLGLIGFEDPVRPNVADAIKECYEAGIRVIMMTGDYPATAKSIARQIGLISEDGTLTGHEIEKMSDDELRRRLNKTNVFARILPEQKLRLVNALKANGEIVAMTGDGVNDAPALKSAHIGVSMGGRGTEVAREASSVVLLDDNFSSIVHGVRLGRRIFDNIRKAMTYTIAVHIPIAGIVFLSVLFGWPLILLPVHIVFLELVIDPACSIVFEREKEESNIMKRPPRNVKEKIFDKRSITFSVLQGMGILVLMAVIYQSAIFMGQTEFQARALTFSILILSNLLLILENRSWNKNFISTFSSRNDAFWIVTLGALAFLYLALTVPVLKDVFEFGALNRSDAFLLIISMVFSVSWFELLKKMLHRGF